MKFSLIDSHCHVHFQAYKEDMDDVIQRTLEKGVGMITIGTQSDTSKKGIEIAEKYDGVWATVGLHPNHLHKQEFFDDSELPPEKQLTGKIKTRSEEFDLDYYTELASHPKVVAIGEFGLDYYRLPPNVNVEQMKADQKAACRAHLKLASQMNKPIVIHCRDAHADQYDLLKEEIDQGGLEKRGVIHSFTGTAQEAQRYIDLGFYIAFNGILYFSKDLQAAAAEIPLHAVLVETDSPYLTPPPNRGKRNEPWHVARIAEKLAEIHNVPVEEVQNMTVKNTIQCFGLDNI